MIFLMCLASAILSMTVKLSNSSLMSFRWRCVTVLITASISLLVILLVKDSFRLLGRRLMCQILQSLPRILRPLASLILAVILLILILALLNIVFIVIVFSMFLCFG